MFYFHDDLYLENRGAGSLDESWSRLIQNQALLAIIRATIVALLLSLFCSTADAQMTDKQWQVKAIEKYPALGIPGSEINKRFIDAYTERRKTNSAFFTNPQWPILLADELAAALSAPVSELPKTRLVQHPTAIAPTPQLIGSGTRSASLRPVLAASAIPRHIIEPSETSESDDSQSSAGIIPIALFAVVGLIIWLFVKRCRHRARLYAEAREYIGLVKQGLSLPTVASDLMLKSGESAFYSAPSVLYETRAVRHYQSGFTGFRVAKGIYIGGSKGRSTSSQEWSKIDSGILTITNKRLIFDGAGTDRSVALGKLLSADSSIDSVEVSVENRQKSMVFMAANPLILATIIRICCQADDPLDLSQTHLDIIYK